MQSDSDKLRRLLEHFSHGMLTTRRGGRLRSRPMAIMESLPPGRIVFFSNVDSGKLEELNDDPNANVAMQDGERFVSVSGTVRIYRDPERADELWKESQRAWFPEGPADPALVLIEIEPQYVEYWDRSSPSALQLILNPSQADLEVLDDENAEHGKLELGSE